MVTESYAPYFADLLDGEPAFEAGLPRSSGRSLDPS